MAIFRWVVCPPALPIRDNRGRMGYRLLSHQRIPRNAQTQLKRINASFLTSKFAQAMGHGFNFCVTHNHPRPKEKSSFRRIRLGAVTICLATLRSVVVHSRTHHLC